MYLFVYLNHNMKIDSLTLMLMAVTHRGAEVCLLLLINSSLSFIIFSMTW